MMEVGHHTYVAQTGNAIGGLHPLKTKKPFYVLLKGRVLEVYKTAKEEKSGKEPKYLFDLSTALNVHLHYDPSLKDCISLMMPDETFYVRFEEDLDDWFALLIDKARQARGTRLGRPVFREEYFEAAWDVEAVRMPKLKKKVKREVLVEDIVAKYSSFLLGRKRLCVYPHSIYVVRRGVTATESTMPPLPSEDFMEFPMNAVSVYGHQERYFFFRAGRCAPTGAGELWFSADSGENAEAISEKIVKICERENEKRKTQRIPTVSSRTIRNPAHRERSHTHTCRFPSENTGSRQVSTQKTSVASFAGFSPSSIHHTLTGSLSTGSAKSSASVLNDSKTAKATSINKANQGFMPIASAGLKALSAPQPTSSKHFDISDAYVQLESDAQPNAQPNFKENEQEESSGGTVVFNAEDCHLTNDNENLEQVSSRYDYSAVEADSMIPSVISAMHGLSTSDPNSSNSTFTRDVQHDGYTQMECLLDRSHQSTAGSDLNYTLTEVRSYISNSTDSFGSSNLTSRSSIAPEGDGHRAYSLGSRPTRNASVILSSPPNARAVPNLSADDMEKKNIEDPRKRAHSLGSKTWLKPLRKISGMRSGGDQPDNAEVRQRADSFGQRAKKRCGEQQTEDLAEWDFGVMGRSGSSSAASVDNISHSRSSSFGISGSALLHSAVEDVLNKYSEKPSANTCDNVEDPSGSLTASGDNEYVLSSYGSSSLENQIVSDKLAGSCGTIQHIISTIMEQNVSSGSSRSESPISFKATGSKAEVSEKEEGEIMAHSTSDRVNQPCALSKIGSSQSTTDSLECAVSNDGILPLLDYALLDVCSDGAMKSLSSDVNVTKNSDGTEGTPKSVCEYTVVEPFKP